MKFSPSGKIPWVRQAGYLIEQKADFMRNCHASPVTMQRI